MLGSSHINEKLLTRRIKNLKRAIAINPHYADLHHDLAIAYTLLGSFINTKAIEEYKRALAINPDFAKAKRNLKLAENEIKDMQQEGMSYYDLDEKGERKYLSDAELAKRIKKLQEQYNQQCK